MKPLAQIKAKIDNITMYRTILYALIGLAVWSWVLGFVGLIDFFPVAMAVQLLIAVGVGYAVDRLLAYVYKVRPNPESIFITAFIMYFLILPNGTVQNFVLTGLAMALAAASKYVITWRGKHLFNPVAFGVGVLGLTGIGYASWWVATPWLLPFVLVAAAMVIYKTRRLDMVLLYIVVSMATIMLFAVINSTANVGLMVTIFTSYPILFFASFMLTEPQTLAPKRKQQNIIAAGVALLAHSQVILGPVAATPELALLFGNAVSALAARRRAAVLQLKSRRQLAGGQVEYRFTALTPISYEAGQYAELHLPHAKPDERGYRRMFTLASRPDTTDVAIITRHPEPASSFKKTLLKLAVGTQIKVTGVWGDFVLPKNQKQKLLFVAGGVGITPFLSQLAWLKHANEQRDIVLIYAIKKHSEAIDLAQYRHLANITTHKGVLKLDDLKQYAPDISERSVYVSGPPVMVSNVSKQAAELGAKSVHKDFFAGY
jgi:glycine betaine catabolism B